MKQHEFGNHWSQAGCLALAMFLAGSAQITVAADKKASGPDVAAWNKPHKPFQIFGNTYYVGTAELSSILITSEFGHVLIDGGLPQSAPQIKANIEALGFKLSEVKAILNSHTHPDHAGGIAELQRQSGADVYALRPANEVLTRGKATADDPQAATKGIGIPKVARVWVAQDDQQIGIGSIRVRAIATPGHTPGGTTWVWDACEGSKCLKAVFADSLNPVSADKYRFSDHPDVVQSFEASYKRLEALPCELLLTPHPAMSAMFERLDTGKANTEVVKDADGCRKYVAASREALAQRLSAEKQSR
jgi:metallo-beta-lactamase class B